MCSSLGPISLGLSEFPELPRSLFPLPDWGSSPSLFFQISFQFLALLLLLAPLCSDGGTVKIVPEVPNPLLIFLNSCFFILVWMDVYFFLLFQIIDLSPGFLPFTVGSLYIFLYFTLQSVPPEARSKRMIFPTRGEDQSSVKGMRVAALPC